jgi:hypothetical protein
MVPSLQQDNVWRVASVLLVLMFLVVHYFAEMVPIVLWAVMNLFIVRAVHIKMK